MFNAIEAQPNLYLIVLKPDHHATTVLHQNLPTEDKPSFSLIFEFYNAYILRFKQYQQCRNLGLKRFCLYNKAFVLARNLNLDMSSTCEIFKFILCCIEIQAKVLEISGIGLSFKILEKAMDAHIFEEKAEQIIERLQNLLSCDCRDKDSYQVTNEILFFIREITELQKKRYGEVPSHLIELECIFDTIDRDFSIDTEELKEFIRFLINLLKNSTSDTFYSLEDNEYQEFDCINNKF